MSVSFNIPNHIKVENDQIVIPQEAEVKMGLACFIKDRFEEKKTHSILKKNELARVVVFNLTNNKELSEKFKSNKKIQELLVENFFKQTLTEKNLKIVKAQINPYDLKVFSEQELVRSIHLLNAEGMSNQSALESRKILAEKMKLITKIAHLTDIEKIRDVDLKVGKNGEVDLKLIKKHQNFIKKIIDRILSFFCSNHGLKTLFDLDYHQLNDEEKSLYRYAANKIERLISADRHFYRTIQDIKRNALLRSCVCLAKSKFEPEASSSISPPSFKTLVKTSNKEKHSDCLECLSTMQLSEIFASLADERFYNRGGDSFYASSLENEAIEKILQDADVTDDHQQLVQYHQNIKESLPINYLIYLSTKDSNTSRECLKFVNQAAELSYQRILNLSDGESLHLDLGYAQHAFRAVFTKNSQGDVNIELFDTSGALEIIEGNFFKGAVKSLFHKQQKIAMSITIPMRSFEKKGLPYLQQLISLSSNPYADKMHHIHSVFNYFSFMRILKSIGGEIKLTSPGFPQEGLDCFAKCIEASQRHRFSDQTCLLIKKQSHELSAKSYLKILTPNAAFKKILREYYLELKNEDFVLSKERFNFIMKRLRHREDSPYKIEDLKLIVELMVSRDTLLT